MIDDETEKSDGKQAVATNKINFKSSTNTTREKGNNEPKVDDTYKRCLTKAAKNMIEESEDGKLKLDDCNVTKELHE